MCCRWCLPISSAGMRLAREDDLHGTPGRVEDARQPFGVVKDQLRALVAGESSGEADGEAVRVEQGAGGDDPRRADVLDGPAIARPLADEGEEIAPQPLAHRPQRLVGDGENRIPQRRVVVTLEPVGAEVRLEQARHVGGDPGRDVHAVGDRRRPADRPRRCPATSTPTSRGSLRRGAG